MLCCKKNPFNDDHVECDEQQPMIYFTKDDIKPVKNHKPPEKKEFDSKFFAKLKKTKSDELEIRRMVSDVTIYICYILIVLTIGYGHQDYNAFLQKKVLETAVIHGGLNCDIGDKHEVGYRECKFEHPDLVDFMKVSDINDWFMWLEYTLLPNVRVQNWYNGKPPYGLRGYLNDRANRLIGYAIIRQIRQEKGHCKPHIQIRDAITQCEGDYSLYTEDTKDYCVRWKLTAPGVKCNTSAEYRYESSASLESTAISGILPCPALSMLWFTFLGLS